MFGFVKKMLPVSVKDEDIIAAISPWMLACAVGVDNGTVGTSMGFEMWFRLSKENWLPKVAQQTGASERAIQTALYMFVQMNRMRNMNEVLREIEQKRGLKPSVTLAPGESMTIEVGVDFPH